MKKKKNELCDICYENKNFFISCQNNKCDKKICHKCIIKILTNYENILYNYKCCYCRNLYDIKQTITLLENINEILEVNDSGFNIEIKARLRSTSIDSSSSSSEENEENEEPINTLRNENLIIMPRLDFEEYINLRINQYIYQQI